MLNKILFTFTFCLFTFSLLIAQWSTSPDSALQIGVGDFTKIISDGHGGAFVTWDGDDWVRTQKIDRYGYVQWTNITPQGGLDVGGSTSDSCWQVLDQSDTRNAMVTDGQGGVYVMFNDVCCIANCQGAPQTVTEALIQHFDSLGNWLWGSGLPVSIRNSYETWTGAIVTDGADGIIALYNERDTVGGPTTLRAQHFDSAGNRLWGNEGVIVKDPGGFRDVDSDGAGGVVIDYDPSLLKRLNSNGQELWGPVFVPSGISELLVDITDQWIYVRNGGGKLRVNKLSLLDGSFLWDTLGVIIDTINAGAGGVSDFELDKAGNVWITWLKQLPIAYFIQKLTPSGTKQFSLPGIPPSPFPSQQTGVKLQSSQDSSMFAIWLDDRNGSNEFYGQRISATGDYIWQNDAQISTIPGGINNMTSDGAGGIILSWKRALSFDILVQQISTNGNLGEILTAIGNTAPLSSPTQFELPQNSPNPFNSFTIIRFYLPRLGYVEFKISDALGREVRKLVSEKRLPGSYAIEWDGRNDDGNAVSSGIYYYRLKVDGRSKTRKMLLIR